MAGQSQTQLEGNSMPERILVIGSGAVGAVYAQALVNAGCLVTFLVRDMDSPNARMPRTLFRYGLIGSKARKEQQHLRIVTQATAHYDAVWLCTPSSAMKSGWLEDQLTAIGANTPLIAWTPDISDIDLLKQWHPGPISQGLIGLISFQCPLPGTDGPGEGIGYLAPPGAGVLDDDEHGQHAADLLKQGGVPAHTRDDLPWWEARMACVNICAIAALEQEEWSLNGLRRSPRLGLAARAGKEAAAGCAAYLGVGTGLFPMVPTKLILKTALVLGPRVMPFPLETYLRYHFTKVGDQTRQIIDGWIKQCEEHDLPCDNLKTLRTGLTD